MKVAVYARYSSDNQREESIEAQIRAIKEFSQRNNHIIVKVYTDEARSATTDDRPSFLQMISDSSMEIFEAIIIHKLDRFSRNRYDSAIYKSRLKKNGIRLISVLENLDDSPESIILESVLEGMAEYYSANLSREVKKGLYENAIKGMHAGGKPPFGYDVKDLKYVINENEAIALRKIYQMYADGSGYSEIIDYLNLSGYKTKTGKPFGKTSVNKIFKNDKYIGTYTYNSTTRTKEGRKKQDNEKVVVIEDSIDPIVSKELWEEVNIKMSSNKNKGARHKSKIEYLLTGKVICGNCNHSMTGNTRLSGKSKTAYSDYECNGRKSKRICNAKGIRKDMIEKFVLDSLINNIFSYEIIEESSMDIYGFYHDQHSGMNLEIENIENQLKSVDKSISNIIEAISNGMFHESMKTKLSELENRKILLNSLTLEASIKNNSQILTIDMIKDYLIKDYKELSDKALIQKYVESVVVHEDEVYINSIVNMKEANWVYRSIFTIYRVAK
jgi:site-specific DNA recombinase